MMKIKPKWGRKPDMVSDVCHLGIQDEAGESHEFEMYSEFKAILG